MRWTSSPGCHDFIRPLLLAKRIEVPDNARRGRRGRRRYQSSFQDLGARREIIWEVGTKIRGRHGTRLRPLADEQGKTSFDEWVDYLHKHPDYLAKFDEVARRLARSEVLSILLTNGDISSSGIMNRLDCCKWDHTAWKQILGIKTVSNFGVVRSRC